MPFCISSFKVKFRFQLMFKLIRKDQEKYKMCSFHDNRRFYNISECLSFFFKQNKNSFKYLHRITLNFFLFLFFIFYLFFQFVHFSLSLLISLFFLCYQQRKTMIYTSLFSLFNTRSCKVCIISDQLKTHVQSDRYHA